MQAFLLIHPFIFFRILSHYLNNVSHSFQFQGIVSFRRTSLAIKTGKGSTKSKVEIHITEISFYPIITKV